MKTDCVGETLRISECGDLTASNVNSFRDRARAAFAPGLRNLDVDLAETSFVDSSGLGALIGLQKAVVARQGVLRLLRPQSGVMQMLRLTRLNTIFEVVQG